MKKSLFTISVLAFVLLSFATPAHLRSQVIFSEDFDSISGPTGGGAGTYSFPAGWGLFNVDALTPAAAVAYMNNAWVRREDFSGSTSDSVAISTSWYTPAGTADDWMISPAITVLPGAILRWSAAGMDPSYPDGYQVWVSTTTADPAGCLAGTKIFETAAENTVWTDRYINLDSAGFTSGTIYIGWRNNSLDQFLLKVDDIVVERLCGSLVIHVDSVDAARTCADSNAYAYLSASGGVPPYSWSWSTSPSDTTTSVTFPAEGYYLATLTDSTGCSIYRGFIVTGSPVPGVADLEANMVTGTFRTGFNTTVHIDGVNHGCIPVSGGMQFIHDAALTFVSSAPVPDLVSGDTLTWYFTGFDHDDPHLSVDVVLYSPLSVSVGDTVCQTVIMNPIPGDYHPVDNFHDGYCDIVVGAVDPNDIQVYPRGECEEHFVVSGTPLTYTIRFQNTGTADAINIHVLDTLDANLDLSSIMINGSSHFMHTEVLPGNVLDFIFNDIHLPDSTTDEPGSHGYLIYEIFPMPGLASGTEVRNEAAIYFDFNPPVITNQSLTTFIDVIPVCTPLSVAAPQLPDLILYPNPTSGRVYITFAGTQTGQVWVYNALGQVCCQLPLQAGAATFDAATWPHGNYYVKVAAGDTVVTKRLVVE